MGFLILSNNNGVLPFISTCTCISAYLAGLPPPCPVTPTTPHAISFSHLSTVPEFHGMFVKIVFVCLRTKEHYIYDVAVTLFSRTKPSIISAN